MMFLRALCKVSRGTLLDTCLVYAVCKDLVAQRQIMIDACACDLHQKEWGGTCLVYADSKDLVAQLLQHMAAIIQRPREAPWLGPTPGQPTEPWKLMFEEP